MFIYKDIIGGDFLIKAGAQYKMKIGGYSAGGFTATNDAAALEIFNSILKGEK